MTFQSTGGARESGAPMTASLPLQRLAESVDDVIAILDLSGRIAYVNRAGSARLGYAANALIGKDARDLAHPDDRESVECALAQVLACPDAPVTVRCRMRHAASGYRVMDTRGTLDAGLPDGPAIVLVSRDITHQHRRQRLQQCLVDALQCERLVLERVLSQCCAALVECFDLGLAFAAQKQANGRLRMLAHAGAATGVLKGMIEGGLRWSGVDAVPCLAGAIRTGKHFCCRPTEIAPCCWLAAGALPAGTAMCVLPLKTADGVIGVLNLLSADHGAFDAPAVALLEDFSVQLGPVLDRITQESRLTLLGGALSAAANAIFITDRHAVIEWVNDAFVALSGFAREELLGRTPRVLHSGVQGRDYYLTLKKTIQAGRSWRGEITNRRKDGALYTAHQTITPILEGARQVRHFVAIQQDVTEHKRMERKIRELVSGVELARQSERDQIGREIHDELGGSLVSLRHDIEWLLKRAPDAAMHERLEIMHELALHSLASARQIVAGLRPVVVDDLGLADAVGWLAREFRQHHELGIELDVDADLARVPRFQAAETYRIVQECLTNVAKHARASRVRISGRINDHLLVFEVLDDGVGAATGAEASGTRGMVERAHLMGGYLEVGPAGGGGTRVRLVVPLPGMEERR